MYQVIKLDKDGNEFTSSINGDKALVDHLRGTFECTGYQVIAVIKIPEAPK